jgi:hypothetical protein
MPPTTTVPKVTHHLGLDTLPKQNALTTGFLVFEPLEITTHVIVFIMGTRLQKKPFGADTACKQAGKAFQL